MQKIDTTIQIFDLEVFSRTQVQLLKILEQKLLGSFPLQTIATPNPEQIVQAERDFSFRQTLQEFEFLLPDGIGLVWASRVLGTQRVHSSTTPAAQISERIAGADVVEALLELSKQHSINALVLGGRGFVASQLDSTADGVVAEQSPGVYEIAPNLWWTPGYGDVEQPLAAEERAVHAAIRKLQPAIVFVAFGAPKQEFWIQKNRAILEKSGVKLAMAVGGAFDFLFGKVSRAPQFMQHRGLEWLYRLWQEPWRWRRQLRLFVFVKIVGQAWLRQRLRP